jgi:hypothetical protein
MRFYTGTHKHYCGIDLHARSMYICVLNQEGTVLLHRNFPCKPEIFLAAIAPFREDLVVAVECVFSWYWVADVCAKEGIAFVLGHALYMRAIHGAKAKNDRIDSHKTAGLLRGGLLPQAYVYPAEMRATRDLMRRRLHFVRQRGQLLATSRTPTTSTTWIPRASASPTAPTEKESARASTTRASVRASPPTSLSSITSRSSSATSSPRSSARPKSTTPTASTGCGRCRESARYWA